MSTVVGAVVQAGSVLFNKTATLERFADLLSQSSKAGAQLAVFPEAFIGGYPKGIDFGVRLGMRMPRGRDDFALYHENAIDVPGEEVDQLCDLVAQAELYCVVGVVERAGGTLYCTMLYISDKGALLGKHRKVMPTALERVVWGQGDGSTLIAPKTDIGVLGGAICWENLMPQVRLAMYGKGVEFYCAPTVDDRETWLPVMRTAALEGRCFVLSACQYMTMEDCPAGYAPENPNGAGAPLIRGGSSITSPMGEVLAGPVFDEEAMLTAEMDTSLIVKGKYDFDVTGHYARPDIFELRINESVRNAVTEEE